jgi:hypothetical protein
LKSTDTIPRSGKSTKRRSKCLYPEITIGTVTEIGHVNHEIAREAAPESTKTGEVPEIIRVLPLVIERSTATDCGTVFGIPMWRGRGQVIGRGMVGVMRTDVMAIETARGLIGVREIATGRVRGKGDIMMRTAGAIGGSGF